MFHIGHLNLIKRAKQQCDFLIVGVSTDDCVREYKNKTPIICFEQRAEIISAIKYVDKVVPQEDMDKIAAHKKLGFDVLFHGDDWKNTELYDHYEREFRKLGVDLVFFPYTKEISSTILKGKIGK